MIEILYLVKMNENICSKFLKIKNFVQLLIDLKKILNSLCLGTKKMFIYHCKKIKRRLLHHQKIYLKNEPIKMRENYHGLIIADRMAIICSIVFFKYTADIMTFMFL